MPKIQIICSSPGIRRNGVEHSASAVYDEDHWTKEQLAAFKADPAFIVQEVAEGGISLSGSAFDAAVSAEVEKQVATFKEALQLSYDGAVKSAIAEYQAKVEKLQTELDTANGKVADLTTKLEAAAKAAEGEAKTETKTTKK